MKKFISFTVVLVVALTITGCYSCDLCGENKVGFGNKTTVLGVSVKYCNDCKKGLNSIKNAFKKEIRKAKK